MKVVWIIWVDGACISGWTCLVCYNSLHLILTSWFPDQLKDAVLSGVALEGEKKDQFNKIQQVSCIFEIFKICRALFFRWLETFLKALVGAGDRGWSYWSLDYLILMLDKFEAMCCVCICLLTNLVCAFFP